MTTNSDFIDADKESERATSRLFELLKDTQKLSEDDLFTEAIAWATLISLYMESMAAAEDGSEMQEVFETIAKATRSRFQAALDHAEEERKNSQGK